LSYHLFQALANYLNAKPFNGYDIYTNVYLRNAQSANYYFYALNLNETNNINVLEKPYYCYHKYSIERYCGFFHNGTDVKWPQIYLFLFSKNLTFVQRNALLESVRAPLVMHFAEVSRTKEIITIFIYTLTCEKIVL
jgi:hypothetical protein